MKQKANHSNPESLAAAIRAARGLIDCDLVIKDVQFLDVFSGKFQLGDVGVYQGKIVGVGDQYHGPQEIDGAGQYLVPGFIDAHVHVESSLMTPARFQQAALPCGTTTVIWDPHEIANVQGVAGIEWALAASEGLALDFYIMVPSCVPSTSPELQLETSGAILRPEDTSGFKTHPRVLGLAEMMNFPGLLAQDSEVMTKLNDYQMHLRDGHCPGLTGHDLNAYGAAGIHSCHESTCLEEAREKLMKGIHVLIREGSCAKDADALLPILNAYSSATLGLCSDDRNPADIAEEGHINAIINKALQAGHEATDIFRAASFGPSLMYGLRDRGAIAPGYLADFVLVSPKTSDKWQSGLQVHAVYKAGILQKADALQKIAEQQREISQRKNLYLNPVQLTDMQIPVAARAQQIEASVIGVIPRQILTEHLKLSMLVKDGKLQVDLNQDVLKIGVFERHHNSGGSALALVKGFQLKKGAIATSINHDSHNVISVGASDAAMVEAINALIQIDGGIVVVDGEGRQEALPLPVAGLMTDQSPEQVTAALLRLKALTRELGCQLEEPFLQLSFLALPVIPSLKITDKGLVDVESFQVIPVCQP
ncbi:MAG: adenine deaminase [Oligoflexus sp.]